MHTRRWRVLTDYGAATDYGTEPALQLQYETQLLYSWQLRALLAYPPEPLYATHPLHYLRMQHNTT